MKTYIAFFDLLGFKEFIFSNTHDEVISVFDEVILNSGISVTHERLKKNRMGGYNPDHESARVNCIHISDSIVFWTNESLPEDFDNLLKACDIFMWRNLLYVFPLRGSIIHGEIQYNPYDIHNKNGVIYTNRSMYGLGLTKAYLKTDEQNWAGCVIDESAINYFEASSKDIQNLKMKKYIDDGVVIKYKVPYSKYCNLSEEYVIKTVKGINNRTALENTIDAIKHVFSKDKKDINSDSVKAKIDNTIEFINFIAGIKK